MIQGLQKTSLVDYPGHIVSTIFYAGCSMQCPFCHNPSLVRKELKEISEDEVVKHLIKRRRFIDGVCITGGEPTLSSSLPGFISRIKAFGFKVKLDTNGTNPDMLKGLIDKNLVDYVAMDIKSSQEMYDEAAGTKVNINRVRRSVDILQQGNVDYEFRTTIVPGLFNDKILEDICHWLKGSKKYFLQQFDSRNELLNSKLDKKTFSAKELKKFAKVAKPFFGVCEVRNI
jgi:pyruvate formate lyase activating enzyme